jgi:hypothetical protein
VYNAGGIPTWFLNTRIKKLKSLYPYAGSNLGNIIIRGKQQLDRFGDAEFLKVNVKTVPRCLFKEMAEMGQAHVGHIRHVCLGRLPYMGYTTLTGTRVCDFGPFTWHGGIRGGKYFTMGANLWKEHLS